MFGEFSFEMSVNGMLVLNILNFFASCICTKTLLVVAFFNNFFSHFLHLEICQVSTIFNL